MRPIPLTKADTAQLEPFAGLPIERIFVPKTEEECAAAVAEILAAGVAGFDTESKPTFSVGEVSAGPHVVQFALKTKAFIFQLHRACCVAVVADLLQSEKVLKVGFGLQSDRGQILAKLGVRPRAILDLDMVFRKRGYHRQIGVRGAIGAVLRQGFHKSKRTTTSNWALPELNAQQLIYAANDAYAALMVKEGLGEI